MSGKKLYLTRKFLNHKGFHSIAFIFACITKSVSKGGINKKTGKKWKKEIWYDCELKISDCNHMIDLSIDTYNKKDAKNTLYKLDILINTLIEFRKILGKEMTSYFKIK